MAWNFESRAGIILLNIIREVDSNHTSSFALAVLQPSFMESHYSRFTELIYNLQFHLIALEVFPRGGFAREPLDSSSILTRWKQKICNVLE